MRAPDPGRRREAVVAVAAFLAPCLLLFRGPLFLGEASFSRDIGPFFYPMKHFLAASVRAGDLPLWNPWIVNGEPFFASLQPGALYPGSLLLYLLPLPLAFDLLLALHYPLAGLGVWMLLRRWGHGAAAAVAGGLAFMLGGYLVSIGNFPNNLQTVAWIPWIALAWDRWLVAGGIRTALPVGLLCAVAFLGGEPQMLALGLLLVAAHGLLGIERPGVARRRQLAGWAGAGGLALGLTAVQLLPFLEFIAHSVRTLDIGLDYVARRSLEPRGLLHLLLPPALDAGAHGFTTRHMATGGVPWLLSVYPGAAVLLFALAGAAARRSDRWLAFWVITALLGAGLALGLHTPLYPALFRWVPLLRPFRYPEKFAFLTAFALAVLAARGVDAWLGGGRAGGRVLRLGLVLAAAYGGVAVWLRFAPSGLASACRSWLEGALLCSEPSAAAPLYAGSALAIAVALAALLGAALLRRRAGLGRGALGLIACVVLSTDLLLAHRAVNPSVDASIYRRPPWTSRLLAAQGTEPWAYRFRGSSLSAAMGSIVTVRGAWELSNMYLDFQTLGPNAGMLFGHPAQDGLQGVELASVALLLEAGLHEWTPEPVRLLRMANVRWYADATPYADSLPGLRLLATAPDLPIRVFEVPDPLPRAYVATEFELAASPAEALRRALRPGFPLATRVALEEEPALPPLRGAPGAPYGEVHGVSFAADRVELRVRSERPALLVLTDRFYPGWRAEVNGRPARILRANGQFRAVAVPAGASRVAFRFQPPLVRIGAWISALTAAAVLALALRGPRPRRGGP